MKKGHYTTRPVDYSKYTQNKVVFHWYDSYQYEGVGCGATALSLLTGVSPSRYAAKVKNKSYPDKFMLQELRKNGFKCIEITQCRVSNHKNNIIKHSIASNHLILTSQLFAKNEASWLVSWNSNTFHNFIHTSSSFYTLLNFPVLTAYILFHPDYV